MGDAIFGEKKSNEDSKLLNRDVVPDQGAASSAPYETLHFAADRAAVVWTNEEEEIAQAGLPVCRQTRRAVL